MPHLKTPYKIEIQKRKLKKISRPAGVMTKSKKRIDLEGEGGLCLVHPKEGRWKEM